LIRWQCDIPQALRMPGEHLLKGSQRGHVDKTHPQGLTNGWARDGWRREGKDDHLPCRFVQHAPLRECSCKTLELGNDPANGSRTGSPLGQLEISHLGFNRCPRLAATVAAGCRFRHSRNCPLPYVAAALADIGHEGQPNRSLAV
jgi:hypothetical protein